MRLWTNKHDDVSFLFHKWLANAYNKLYAKFWTYLNMESIY